MQSEVLTVSLDKPQINTNKYISTEWLSLASKIMPDEGSDFV
jgi:hypothetical protein